MKKKKKNAAVGWWGREERGPIENINKKMHLGIDKLF
jgi:hypothetical protein